MRLTQIKLSGFKSFVDLTTIPTPTQLVGVVGPNGCGKSNIIDAVRWVLGETKASELRGESMQDVIFNGSVNRKPVGRASVELVFDNSDGRVTGQWSAYTEIAVRRVLTRDGASSYLINNQQVRRRDIHDLFLGTGLGSRGYAIIGQGMINRLIEAKPEELRVYLEEVAGVSRYKERRRETENRLHDTKENLTRVQDILGELENQLSKLATQAEIATTYRNLQNDGQKKQHVLWLIRERHTIQEEVRVAAQIEKAKTELEAKMADMRTAESQVETCRQAHYQAVDALHSLQAGLYEANSKVSRLESEIRHAVDARNRLQQRKSQLIQQRQEWDEQYNYNKEQITLIEEEIEITAARHQEAIEKVEQAQQKLPDLEQKLRQSAQEREQMRSALSVVEQKLALLGQQQHDAGRQLQQLQQRKERLSQEKQQIQVPDLNRLTQLQSYQDVLLASIEEAQTQLLALEERLPDLQQNRQEAQRKEQEAQGHATKLEARLQALSKLQEDVMQKGSLEPWLKKHELSQISRLWKKIQIENGWGTALESVLRERLMALQVHDLNLAQAFETDVPPARLAFFQVPPAAPLPVPADGLTPLSSLIRCHEADLKALLANWLCNTYVVELLSEALAMRQRLPPNAQFVVKQGHLVDAYGVSFYAAESEQAGMLSRQQEIENLQRETKAARLIADQAVACMSSAEIAWNNASKAMVPARQRLSELTSRLHEVKLSHSQLQQQIQQSDQLSARLDEDLQDIETQSEELRASLEKAQIEFENLDESLAGEQEKYEQAQLQGEEIAQQADLARQAIQEDERVVRDIEYEQRSMQSRLSELGRNLNLAGQQSEQARIELENLEGELYTFDARASQVGLQDALEERAIKQKLLDNARITADNLMAELRHSDEQRMLIEQSLQPCREWIVQLQLDAQASNLAAKQFSELLDAQQVDRQALSVELESLPPEWQKVSWLQSEVQRVSKQIDSLGPVNLAALDELNQAQERKSFLDLQQDDLNKAIHTLEAAISKIDGETRDLLQETFDTVNKHFGELFPLLFGGGEAKLKMIGDEILDSGVQVIAQPPGKRNTTIYLLSGGEKALTATALVFALFKLNPAPFCLLDEVDAPLDDANTERFANLVRSMGEQTQFLFISHNRIAMQMAKQLIGVTMQEQGVSRIVAVDVDAAVHLVNEA